ncbi:ferroptosis suppressor protein 1 [Hyla sarda]|uniref:ferroptosis suppressor protein 1 n=1 Tax=Hyla sarda TaxID=327740 RepID=UPI0024C2B68B|nr:ferroptosis suppressor protein 1 [Hyla sarda]XP_056386671.1 ferroptosis suppressor protein 1 [Hyla sarda]XP_056386672.1 ferroptosis suppressor protein 1 [Hyla sarda]XP_056386673.1 ferroptosis suppressor protein 1 [Hyla sarda]
MGSKLSVDESVQVVIVGGGFAGIAAANQLKSSGIPFVLVDIRDAFHHNVAALRASVESGFARKTFISYKDSYQGNFKQGRVVGINLQNNIVVLENNEEIHFSHLIIATGSDGPFPGKFNTFATREMAIQIYEDLVKQVQNAKHVVVVGGGSAGVEMAAELKTDYPDKEVTLIHSRVALADVELLPRVRQTIKEILLQKGVRLVLGQRVSNLDELTLNTVQENMKLQLDKDSEVITADLVLCCTGLKINSSCYVDAFGDKVASDGALKVNDHLQVEGHNNIYAVGDCADLRGPKMAYLAGLHAQLAVTNIIHSLMKKPLKTYKAGPVSMLLSMGRNDGTGQFNGHYMGRYCVTLLKSRDLFVSKSWKEMGQKMPK